MNTTDGRKLSQKQWLKERLDILTRDRDLMEKELNRTSLVAQSLRKALEDAVSCFGEDDALVTEERIEAWKYALNYKGD